jgi:uncharacterized membrane protein YidH (DUF202 family)
MNEIDKFLNKTQEVVQTTAMDYIFNMIAFIGLLVIAIGINNFFNPEKGHDTRNKKSFKKKKTYAVLEIIGGAMMIGIQGIYLLFN